MYVPKHNQLEDRTALPAYMRAYETVFNFVRTTKTEAGLAVNATLLDGDYPTGIRVSEAQMDKVHLRQHGVLPMWNYTLVPARSKM